MPFSIHSKPLLQQRNAIKRARPHRSVSGTSRIPDYAREEIWIRRKWEEWRECLKGERQMRVPLGEERPFVGFSLYWKCRRCFSIHICVDSVYDPITCLQQDND